MRSYLWFASSAQMLLCLAIIVRPNNTILANFQTQSLVYPFRWCKRSLRTIQIEFSCCLANQLALQQHQDRWIWPLVLLSIMEPSWLPHFLQNFNHIYGCNMFWNIVKLWKTFFSLSFFAFIFKYPCHIYFQMVAGDVYIYSYNSISKDTTNTNRGICSVFTATNSDKRHRSRITMDLWKWNQVWSIYWSS